MRHELHSVLPTCCCRWRHQSAGATGRMGGWGIGSLSNSPQAPSRCASSIVLQCLLFGDQSSDCPTQVIYYLSGLTCTDENFIQKAGAQRKAAELRVALVAPDTSPRGLGIEGEDDRWELCRHCWLARLLACSNSCRTWGTGRSWSHGGGLWRLFRMAALPPALHPSTAAHVFIALFIVLFAAGILALAPDSTWTPRRPSGSGTACTRTSPASCLPCCAPRQPSWTWTM